MATRDQLRAWFALTGQPFPLADEPKSLLTDLWWIVDNDFYNGPLAYKTLHLWYQEPVP